MFNFPASFSHPVLRMFFTALVVCTFSAVTPHLFADPYAAQDAGQTDIGETVQIDVLSNDMEYGSPLDPSTVTVEYQPYYGVTASNGDGTISYTPSGGYYGWDDFYYTVKDEEGNISNEAQVIVLVVAPDAPPARDDEAYAHVDEMIYIDVIANDGDLVTPLDPSTVVQVTVNQGWVYQDGAGGFYYFPPYGYSGHDYFTYVVSDVYGVTSNLAYVNVHMGDNKPPKITEFDAMWIDGNTWFFSGYVEDENLWGMHVTLGGILDGETAQVMEDGVFSIEKEIQAGGIATAFTTDEFGLESNVAECYCDQ